MHRVRLFGVNATAGIDDEIDYRRSNSRDNFKDNADPTGASGGSSPRTRGVKKGNWAAERRGEESSVEGLLWFGFGAGII